MPSGESLIGGVNARDVYSKRRIIVVTELKIVEWHNYKHLDWITMRRDDDKLYKFKEGDQSESRRMLCFQRLSSNVYKKHRHPKACERPLTRRVESYQRIYLPEQG
nr:hypothetical protein [Tanacetum cinerariifolium]